VKPAEATPAAEPPRPAVPDKPANSDDEDDSAAVEGYVPPRPS
jgi:hypothetical protein